MGFQGFRGEAVPGVRRVGQLQQWEPTRRVDAAWLILPCSPDKTLLPEFVQRIASVNYVLQERCPFESDVDPIVLSDA